MQQPIIYLAWHVLAAWGPALWKPLSWGISVLSRSLTLLCLVSSRIDSPRHVLGIPRCLPMTIVLQIPSAWRPAKEDPSTLALFLDFYSTTQPPLSNMALECLVRDASRGLFQGL